VLVSPSAADVKGAARGLGRERGVDAALELTGTPTFSLSLRALRPGGRVVLVGNTVPGRLELEPGLAIVKELGVVGSAHATRADLADVVDLVATGQLTPPPVHTYALREAGLAHAELDAKRMIGRAVLIP
jgi:D-arabinose 1-dehydrogenase-like Zn-dependent alcohol dehydrogenase